MDYGLIIGVCFSILSVVFRMQSPSSHLLGRIPNTDIYKNVAAYTSVSGFDSFLSISASRSNLHYKILASILGSI